MPLPEHLVDADLYRLIRHLDELIIAVQEGRQIQLSGLENDAEALCTAALALPAEQAKRRLPQLQSLIRRLESLQAGLQPPTLDPNRYDTDRQPAVTRQRAIRAYSRD